MMSPQGIASGDSGTALVHTFIDKPYNRTGFTLASPVPQQVLGPPLACLTDVLDIADIAETTYSQQDIVTGLMGAFLAQLARTAVQLARAALAAIDLRLHSASHPRLGVVDHISCHPLATDAALSSATEVARLIGTTTAIPGHYGSTN